MSTLLIHACWKSPSRVDVSKDQRGNQVRLANYANELSGNIGNINRKFPPKTGMREKQVLQDPGYVATVDTCCMLHAMK